MRAAYGRPLFVCMAYLRHAGELLLQLMRIMVCTRLVTTALGDGFWSRVNTTSTSSVPRDPGSRFRVLTKHRCASQKRVTWRIYAMQGNYFSNLCGLWFAHALLLQRSGMVFVPAIMRDWQRGQIAPVGRALIACLQSG
jgi:hypothetical protein